MSILDTFRRSADELTPAERRLVEVVVDRPREAALGTVADLARSAGVHDATVSRLARKLGFDGYAAFRSAMRDEFIPSREPATRLQRTIDKSDPGSILGDLVHREGEALVRVLDYVEPEAVLEVARLLSAARTVHLFGRGNAEVLSLLMLKRLRRFGMDVRALSGEPRELAEQSLAIGAGDVILCFAFRRTPRRYAELREIARESGARVVVVADLHGPTISPAPDVMLAAPRAGDTDGYQTLTVPMALCNAVVLATGALHEDRSLRTLELLGERLERLE